MVFLLQNLRLEDHTPMLPKVWYPYHCLALGEIVWVLLQVLEIANGFSIGNPQFLPLFALFRGWKRPAWLPVSMCMHGRGIICLFVRI